MKKVASDRTLQGRRQGLLAAALAGSVAALSVVSPQGRAAGPVVEVGPSAFQHILNQVNTLSQKVQDKIKYAQENSQWLRTLQQYQQQLIKIQGLMAAFTMPAGLKFEKVAPDFNVQERCGGSGGFSIASVAKVMGIDPQGDVIAQQRQICASIQMIQNQKQNDTVEFLEKTMKDMSTAIGKIDARRAASQENGAVDANTNDAVTSANKIQVAVNEWETRMQAYDYYVQALETQQRQLASTALKGSKSSTPLGTVVKTATLKAALSID